MPKKISKEEFYYNLPKKRMAAGAIFRDDQKRILFLKPNYKDVLEIPGGIVEEDEILIFRFPTNW